MNKTETKGTPNTCVGCNSAAPPQNRDGEMLGADCMAMYNRLDRAEGSLQHTLEAWAQRRSSFRPCWAM